MSPLIPVDEFMRRLSNGNRRRFGQEDEPRGPTKQKQPDSSLPDFLEALEDVQADLTPDPSD